MATVTLILRKDKINSKGLAPIHFRIIKNRKPSYIASTITILPKEWDPKNNRIKPTHKNSARLNSFLSHKFTEIQDTVFKHETVTNTLSSKGLREKVFGKAPPDFFAFAEEVLLKYKREGKIGTYHKNCSIIMKLKSFHGSQGISFYDITLDHLLRYEKHLREHHHNKTNTVNKDMRFIRKVFNDAIRQDVIPYEANPFRNYQLRLEKTSRTYLTEQELSWIERYPATPGSKIELHRDMFVFATYTGGLRVSDILRLQWANFDGSHINLVIKKTGVQVAIKVPRKGLEILAKYKPSISRNEAFIFKILPEKLDLNDPEKVDKAISGATSHINNNLKLIASAVGIEKNLSFHISRHSFAILALRKGISLDKVSKLMAHAAIKETQVYAKVVNEDLDKAMDLFNN